MNTKHSTRLGMVLAVAMAVVSGPASFADPQDDPPSVKVRYGDLDLAREDGVQTLYSRLRAAARRVCDVGVYRQLVQQALSRRCMDQALGTAVATLGNAQLSALHSGGMGQPAAPRIAATGR